MSDNKKRIAIVCGKGTGGQLEAAIRKKLQSLGVVPVESSVSVHRADASGTGEDLLNAAKQKLTELSGQPITSAEEIPSARIADDDVNTRERYIHDLIGDVESEMIASEFYPGMDRVDWHTTDDAIIILAKFIGGFEEITVPFADLQMDFSKMEEDVKTIMDGIFQSPDVGGTYEEQQDVTSSDDIDGEYSRATLKPGDRVYVTVSNRQGTVLQLVGDDVVEVELDDNGIYPARIDRFYTSEVQLVDTDDEDAVTASFGIYDDEDGEEDPDWEYVKSKSVQDSDGFSTDYTMYRNKHDGTYIFMFGDNEIYLPDPLHADYTCETEEEAEEWFDSYTGFEDTEDGDFDFVDYGDDEGFTDEEMANITGGDRRYCPECGSDRYYDGVCYKCLEEGRDLDDDVMSSEDINPEHVSALVSAYGITEEQARKVLYIQNHLDTPEGYRAYYELEKEIVDNQQDDNVLYDLAADFKWDNQLTVEVNKLAIDDNRPDLVAQDDYSDESEVYSCNRTTSVRAAFETGWYFGKEQADQYGDLICEQLSGRTVSKRRDTAEEPGGLIYEANQLGIDMWDLLGALEGLCYQGRAREIDDSTYRVA